MKRSSNIIALSVLGALLLATGGCASNQNATSRGLTGSIEPGKEVARAEEEEAPRPVPADPYKGVRYQGGRDPVTGAAPNLDGQLPPPPAPLARKAAPRTQVASAAGMPAAPATRGAVTRASIQVQPGDTLSSISRKHGVSVAALMQANALATPKIAAGQTLVLPAK